MQRNKVYSVTTINAVAAQLGVCEDLLHELSAEMDPEDGVIRVYGIGEESILAFTSDGIDELKNLIKIHRDNPNLFRSES